MIVLNGIELRRGARVLLSESATQLRQVVERIANVGVALLENCIAGDRSDRHGGFKVRTTDARPRDDNLAIALNVIRAAYDAGVSKLVFLGSSCIYPRNAPQPMREESLLGGALEPTNEPYAIAKLADEILSRSVEGW